MKKTLYDFREIILQLPVKKSYTKEELLIPDFLLEQEGELEIYYAPHNEYINPYGRVFIIGITPGFQQMNTAMVTARKGLEAGDSIEKIQYDCKVAGRFSGVIRKNIISMLDVIGLQEKFSIVSCSELFGEKDQLLHTVSLIPYSVFVKKQNYTGHTPKLMKTECLKNYIYDNFIKEYHRIERPKETLLIPLGRAVEEALCMLGEEGVISRDQILRHFPHPSGANVNRVAQLEEYKEEMREFIKKF